jgi:hypothetical protein
MRLGTYSSYAYYSEPFDDYDFMTAAEQDALRDQESRDEADRENEEINDLIARDVHATIQRTPIQIRKATATR